MLMSTGSGIFVGSSMTADLLRLPLAGGVGLMSQSLEVSAVAVIAQVSPSLSDQPDLERRAGNAQDLLRFIRLRSQTAMVFPERFMASASFTSSPGSACSSSGR